MKLKSITFRCSQPQLNRLEEAMLYFDEKNRTAFITTALEDFLAFAEQKQISNLNLFELVHEIDAMGRGEKFANVA